MDDQRVIIAELSTKMDYVIQSVNEMKTYVVHKAQFEALEKRVDKLEGAPHKWVSLIVSAVGVGVAIIAVILKQ